MVAYCETLDRTKKTRKLAVNANLASNIRCRTMHSFSKGNSCFTNIAAAEEIKCCQKN